MYALSPKLLELGDQAVFGWTHGLVAGHTLKHVVAACAIWPLCAALSRRPHRLAGAHVIHNPTGQSLPDPRPIPVPPRSRADMTHPDTTARHPQTLPRPVWLPAPQPVPTRQATPTSLPCCASAGLRRFLDAVFRRGQRQPVQVRLHRHGHLPAATGLAAAIAGRAGDRRAVHPAVSAVSATSGQLADKYDKRSLIILSNASKLPSWRWPPGASSAPMCPRCWPAPLMGLHSTLFGPVKFAYMPQHLSERELTGGNGMVEMGTFVAILLGNVAGGPIIAVPGHRSPPCRSDLPRPGPGGAQWWRTSFRRRHRSGLRINWNPCHRNLAQPPSWRTAIMVVFRSLLGISWMWFSARCFWSQFPSFAKDVLHGNEQVASLLLVVFSVGIAPAACCAR